MYCNYITLPLCHAASPKVNDLYDEERIALEEKLSKAPSLSLRAGFWTSIASHADFGVTMQRIDDRILCLETLRVRHIPERHTAEHPSKEFVEVPKI